MTNKDVVLSVVLFWVMAGFGYLAWLVLIGPLVRSLLIIGGG